MINTKRNANTYTYTNAYTNTYTNIYTYTLLLLLLIIIIVIINTNTSSSTSAFTMLYDSKALLTKKAVVSCCKQRCRRPNHVDVQQFVFSNSVFILMFNVIKLPFIIIYNRCGLKQP